MNLVFHTGNQALTHVRTDDFQSKWKSLYERCPWATSYQHPDFVTPWYELYHARFLPVIVLAEAEDHSFIGLLTIAFDRGRKALVGAGERQAEYHGWLVRNDTGNTFIQKAICEILERFPGVDLCLKYLPPGIPLYWISHNREYQKFCRLRSHPRPIMKIDEAAMKLQRSKKNNRQNFNRLKRLGEVKFERITEHNQFVGVFDQMCMQYDFRQAALHRQMPFSSDPSKKLFYLELHKRGLLHTTILKVGEEIAASHFGLLSNACAVHLGINTHSPVFAAHSPGSLLLAMLGVHLVQERIPVLDLTPGGDGYKEHFATEHDVVFELTAYGDVKGRLKNEALLSARKFLKDRMQKAGVRTADVWAALGRLTGFRELGFHGWLQNMRRTAALPSHLYRYCPGSRSASAEPLAISRDSLTDIFRFDPRGSAVTRSEFLNLAMERLERSNHLYSFGNNEKLLLYCWVGIRPAGANQQQADKDTESSDNAIVLFDLYVHRGLEEKDLVQRFIEQILCEMKDHCNDKNIYLSGPLDDELQTVIRQCGFIDEGVQA